MTALPPIPPVDELPEGVWESVDGKLFYTCIGCDQTKELEGDPEGFDPDMAYCGGSPRCCP